MATYVTSAGIEIPALTEILAQLSDEQRAQIDALLPTDPDSVIGDHNAIYASHERELWEVLEIVFWGMDPRKAEGALLDAVLAIRGSKREPATPSTFKGTRRLEVTLEAGESVTPGVTRFGIPGTDIEFVVLDVDGEDTSNPGPGTLVYLISAECTVDGPTVAPAGQVTQITVPGPGNPSAVTNPFDAVLGSVIESDAAFRVRSEKEIGRSGSGTYRAVYADLIALRNDDGSSPVRSVTIIENGTSTDGVNGLPAHSYQILLWDGPGQDAQNAAVFEVLLNNKVPGIGQSLVRPTQKKTEIDLQLVTTTGYAGNDAVRAAIVAYFDVEVTPRGADAFSGFVAWSKIAEAALTVEGVDRVDQITISIAGQSTVVNSNSQPGEREVAVIEDSADITFS